MSRISTLEQLEAIYGSPGKTSLIKEVPHVIPHYRKFIEASPFCTLATIDGSQDIGGMDCPRARSACWPVFPVPGSNYGSNQAGSNQAIRAAAKYF